MRIFQAIVLIIALLVPFNLLAEEKDNTVLAERFMEVLKLKEQNDQMMEMLQEQIDRQRQELSKTYKLDKEKQKQVDKYMDQMLGILFDEINWDKLKPERIQIINSIYSEQELKDLINFFKTDLGIIFVTKQQATMQKLGVVAQQSTQRMMKRMQELQKKMQADLKN